jgi:uncharacterized membrane protein YhaH (DUF805 family)
MEWYIAVLKKYATFTGRSRRKEYWFFALFNIIISIVLTIVDAVFGTLSVETGLGLLSGVYSLAVLIPSIAVTVRRLHDVGRSGWWLLIAFLPLVGVIVLLVFMLQDSKEENEYGISPKLVAL